MNVLVINAEKEIADLVEIYLKKENYDVFKFYNINKAMQCINNKKIDLAILDIKIGDYSGIELCKTIRYKALKFPIIMLIAKVEDEGKLKSLTFGADDYITKPFNPYELIMKVKSVIKRYIQNDEENTMYLNGLEINKDKHICILNDKEIKLTPLEFDILLYLISKKGHVVSAEELFEKVWKEKYLENNNTVMVHIRRIREKLNDDTRNPKFIKTIWGVGYKIE